LSFARTSRTSEPGSPRIVSGVRLDGRTVDVPYGTPVGRAFKEHLPAPDVPVLAALVHHRCVDLTYPICAPSEIHPVDYTMREGVLVYRKTASFVLLEAARELFPGARVTVGQALGNGYFYRIHVDGELTREQVNALEKRMRALVDGNVPLRTETVSIAEAREAFAAMGLHDKVRLLTTYWEPFVPVVRCGGFCDIHRYPVAPSAGLIHAFELVHYPPGLILRFPPRGRRKPIGPYRDAPKLFQTYKETREWNRILGVEDVGQLNDIIVRGEAAEVIRVAEGLQEKKIGQVADRICHAPSPIKLVLIAGPSASGKTTFAKRLALQLKVNGISPVALSMDNFYVDRVATPLDEDGNYDFESIEAIDLALFNDVLARLLRGESLFAPKFDFPNGCRAPTEKWTPMHLKPGQVLMVEGIHGLNERLTEAVEQQHKFKVYVSALTQLSIDDHNRIFTSDSRFLRRIVRDRLFRGYRAQVTIETWPRVRRGEMRNIFPYQEKADVMFNSALVYEQAVLRLFAERFLLEVPQDHPSFGDAYRLLKFVQNFVPIFEQLVPQISLLREFVGGSGFKY
jgi:uridine kinase